MDSGPYRVKIVATFLLNFLKQPWEGIACYWYTVHVRYIKAINPYFSNAKGLREKTLCRGFQRPYTLKAGPPNHITISFHPNFWVAVPICYSTYPDPTLKIPHPDMTSRKTDSDTTIFKKKKPIRIRAFYRNRILPSHQDPDPQPSPWYPLNDKYYPRNLIHIYSFFAQWCKKRTF